MTLQSLNTLLGYGSIALEIFAIAFLLVFFLRRSFPDLNDIGDALHKWGIQIGFFTTLSASAVTLIHSEIFNLPPCPLCWVQRAFLYPQVLLFAYGWYKRDVRFANYSIVLSLCGIAVAAYHHALQMFPTGNLPCPSVGVSCAQILFLEFGYITYPMMALSLFAFLISIMLSVRSPRAF